MRPEVNSQLIQKWIVTVQLGSLWQSRVSIDCAATPFATGPGAAFLLNLDRITRRNKMDPAQGWEKPRTFVYVAPQSAICPYINACASTEPASPFCPTG